MADEYDPEASRWRGFEPKADKRPESTASGGFDWRRQVDEHPFAVIGGAIAVGFAAGWAVQHAGNAEGFGRALAPEIDRLKGLAIGMVMGALRDFVTQNVPEPVSNELIEVMDSATGKLGGKPIESQVIQEILPHWREHKPNGLHGAPPASV